MLHYFTGTTTDNKTLSHHEYRKLFENTNEEIKILFAHDHLGWDGQVSGVARLFRLWAMNLNSGRYKVNICILRGKNNLSRIFEEKGINVFFQGKSKFDPTPLFSLINLIRKEKINILHLQSYGAITLGRLAGKITGIPVIVHFHDTHLYYPWIQKLSDRIFGDFADAYLAVSNSVKDLWSERCGINPSKITVLKNCTSLDEFNPMPSNQIKSIKREMGIDPSYNIIGTVTRLFDIKGTEYFIKAAPEVLKVFPKTKFIIVGDGPQKKQMAELTEHLGIKNDVIFTGYLENVAPVLGIFDIKVLASFNEGGSPLSVLEAMAMGKPVIVTDIIEIVQNNFNGLVIPPKNEKALADKIIYLIGNKNIRKRLGINARETSKQYDVKEYVKNLKIIYNTLILKNGKKVA